MAGRHRPPNIEVPGPGQESVWDYPRPPAIEPVAERIRVEFAGRTIADSTRAVRVIETSLAPSYYLPPEDVHTELLLRSTSVSFCEWKGRATYWTVRAGERSAKNAAWSYEQPAHAFERIKGWLSFYPSRVDACWVGDERVQAQQGDFYGGWVTSNLVGPIKGGPGSQGW